MVSSKICTSQPSAGMLGLSLGLHLCGWITISMRASLPRLLFSFFCLSFYLLYQIFLLWQNEHKVLSTMIPPGEQQQKLSSETKRQNAGKAQEGVSKDEEKITVRKCECVVCFEEMGDKKLGQKLFCWRPKRHSRALLIPCGHASVCTSCAMKLWKSVKNECPVCRARMTRRPKRLPAAIYLWGCYTS